MINMNSIIFIVNHLVDITGIIVLTIHVVHSGCPHPLNCPCQVEREENYQFLLKYLSTFAGDLPTKYEVEAPT